MNAPFRSAFAEGLRVCVDILRLRRGPEDMPSGVGVLVGMVACQLLLSVMLLARPPGELHGNPVVLMCIEIIFTLAGLKLVLQMARHPERFLQTAASVFGCRLLMAPLLIGVSWMLLDAQSPPMMQAAGNFVTVVLGLWLLVATVRIVRAATEWQLPACIAVIFAIEALTALTILSIYPLPPETPVVPAPPA